MIFAQRPDAAACAEYDLWNNAMNRYVRRGSKGIALVDHSREKPRLRYVFDISDTGARKNSRYPFLWQLRPEHKNVVAQALAERFGVPPEASLAEQLEKIAVLLTDEYWTEYRQDILDIVDGSLLEGYDELNIETRFKKAAAASVTYSLIYRCGMEKHFTQEDFFSVVDFNTSEAVAALGTAVSQSNQQVLRQISLAIQNYERVKFAERSVVHGEEADLHEERRLPDSRFEAGGNEAPGPVREDAPGLPEGASAGSVQRPAGERETVPALKRDRADHEPEAGADNAGADGDGRRDGRIESQRYDDLGGADEQLQSPGGGNPSDGAYIQLNLFPSDQKKIWQTDEEPGDKASGSSDVKKPFVPDLSGQPITREGDTITIGNGEPTHELDITVSDEEYDAEIQSFIDDYGYEDEAEIMEYYTEDEIRSDLLYSKLMTTLLGYSNIVEAGDAASGTETDTAQEDTATEAATVQE